MAVLVGVLHAGASPVLSVADVKPNLVLVAVAVVALAGPIRAGWVALVAGITVDIAVGGTLGSTSLGLLVVAAAIGAASAAVDGLRTVHAPAAVIVGGLAAALLPLAGRDAGVTNPAASVWIASASALMSAAVAAVVVVVASTRARGRRTISGASG